MSFNLPPGSVQIFDRQPGETYPNPYGPDVPIDDLTTRVDRLIQINLQETERQEILQLQQSINECIDEVRIEGAKKARVREPTGSYTEMAEKLLGKRGEITNFLSHNNVNGVCSKCGILTRFHHRIYCPAILPPIIEGGRRKLRNKRTLRNRRTRRNKRTLRNRR